MRETNYCRIALHTDERTGKVFVFAAIDNLWKGTASQAVQCLNLMFRAARDRGDPLVGFFPLALGRPPGPRRRGGRRPAAGAGFRAAGVAAGSSRAAGSTSACSSTAPRRPVSAARFTASGVLAAPVMVTKERARLDALRAVVVSSGNANAATGRPELDEAARMQGAGAMAASVATEQVAVAATGVIGVLDGQKVVQGLLAAHGGHRPTAPGSSPTRSRNTTTRSTSARRSTSRCPRAASGSPPSARARG
ncbi:MAG: bifunctional ornithine acetyltransferase/N-acetylglutamate synthase [Solirubrobacteraceae bacterium]